MLADPKPARAAFSSYWLRCAHLRSTHVPEHGRWSSLDQGRAMSPWLCIVEISHGFEKGRRPRRSLTAHISKASWSASSGFDFQARCGRQRRNRSSSPSRLVNTSPPLVQYGADTQHGRFQPGLWMACGPEYLLGRRRMALVNHQVAREGAGSFMG